MAEIQKRAKWGEEGEVIEQYLLRVPGPPEERSLWTKCCDSRAAYSNQIHSRVDATAAIFFPKKATERL